MKFSGKMCFEIILKVTKNQGFTLSLEDTFFDKRSFYTSSHKHSVKNSVNVRNTLMTSMYFYKLGLLVFFILQLLKR